MSDHELLQLYSRDHSQSAFATLVERYLNLVYSAARRQVRSPQLAEEIVQSVFLELARRGPALAPTQSLAAWLYVVTRRVAVNALRHESRRLARETAAAELAAMQTPSESWLKVEADLDEAMETLNDTERTAIVLRFFQNLSLREVGESLGLSEDTAQKRVSRALDRLRSFFLRRGIAVTATGLAADLGAHAVITAPASLATTLTAPALLSATGPIAVTAMTTLQKSALALAVGLLASFAIYEATIIRKQRHELALVTGPSPALRVTPAIGASSAAPVANLPSTTSALPANPTSPDLAATPEQRVALLKQLLAELPAQNLPELKLLASSDWLEIARVHELDNTADIRVALADLRAVARRKFAEILQESLRNYTKASAGQLPTDIAQLIPYLTASADAEMLARYNLIRTGKIGEPSEKLLREKTTSDLILSVGLDGWGLTNNAELPAAMGETEADAFDRVARALGSAVGDDAAEKAGATESLRAFAASMEAAMKNLEPVFGAADGMDTAMKQALAGFAAAHPGEAATNVAQVLPFLKEADKFVAAFRPVFAQQAYLREHGGQPPPAPAELEPYLARPFSADTAFRDMKISQEGGRITVDFDLPGNPQPN